MARLTIRNAVAMHLGEDGAEMERTRRYQPTRTPCPVYSVGNDYLTASGATRRPKDDRDWRWVRVPSDVTKLTGWKIWKARV